MLNRFISEAGWYVVEASDVPGTGGIQLERTREGIEAGRYWGDVAFSFDSNGRSVWVIALFGKDAPPTLSAVVRKYGDVFAGRSEFRSPFETALQASSG